MICLSYRMKKIQRKMVIALCFYTISKNFLWRIISPARKALILWPHLSIIKLFYLSFYKFRNVCISLLNILNFQIVWPTASLKQHRLSNFASGVLKYVSLLLFIFEYWTYNIVPECSLRKLKLDMTNNRDQYN